MLGLGGAVAIAASIGVFYLRSDRGGAALRHRFAASTPASSAPTSTAGSSGPRTASVVPCSQTDPTRPGQAGGILRATEIGLDAPVVQGDADAELAVAVGHVPASAWPDQEGTTVLAAHDVSWFSRIDHLRPGQTITFAGRCTTRTYTVTAGKVVRSGSPVYNTTTPRLVLVTCYPLDALFLTPNRYEVTATLTKVTFGGARASVPPPGYGSVPTSLPASVAANVGPRVTTTAPLGPLHLAGTPARTWAQSDQPINAAGSALELYFGALQVAESSPSLWHQVAPSVPASAITSLDGANVTAVPGPVTPTLEVSGSRVTGATVTSTVTIAGGPDPGTYSITMHASVVHRRLTVSDWTVSPA